MRGGIACVHGLVLIVAQCGLRAAGVPLITTSLAWAIRSAPTRLLFTSRAAIAATILG